MRRWTDGGLQPFCAVRDPRSLIDAASPKCMNHVPRGGCNHQGADQSDGIPLARPLLELGGFHQLRDGLLGQHLSISSRKSSPVSTLWVVMPGIDQIRFRMAT